MTSITEHDRRKDLARTLQREAFEKGNTDIVDEMVTADFVDHGAPAGTPSGPAGVKSVVAFLHSGLDDIRYDIHEMLADGDLVAYRATMSATHARMFLGFPPTGIRFHAEHLHLVRFAGDKIAEHWAVRDDLSMMHQIGATLVPPVNAGTPL